MNDLIRLACERACESFEHGGNIFNAAGFSTQMRTLSGCQTLLDGQMVRTILTGRPDVRVLSGGCHYQLNAATGGENGL